MRRRARMVEKVVRTERGARRDVMDEIARLDPRADFDPEGNPVTFWVTTRLSEDEIEDLDGVVDVVSSGLSRGREAAERPDRPVDEWAETLDHLEDAIKSYGRMLKVGGNFIEYLEGKHQRRRDEGPDAGWQEEGLRLDEDYDLLDWRGAFKDALRLKGELESLYQKVGRIGWP